MRLFKIIVLAAVLLSPTAAVAQFAEAKDSPGAGGPVAIGQVAAQVDPQVDPQGQMDPAARKLLAVANADPSQQFGVLQHYRQKFNALNAYAQQAAQGTQQRPANLQESTDAATRAYHNVPSGHSLSFTPQGNKVVLSATPLTSGSGKSSGGKKQKPRKSA